MSRRSVARPGGTPGRLGLGTQSEREMRRSIVAIAAFGLSIATAQAADELKIGLIATLSGPPAVLGQQLRNGFTLALKTLGGRLGGRDVNLIVTDDELKPDVAVTKVKAFIDRDRVDFVVGPVFSNILQAIFKPVTEANVILISPNAGTSSFAGQECSENFFVTSYQNDQVHGVLGRYAQESGIKTVILIAPNYQAGRDAAAGFKRLYGGEIRDEIYVPLGQLDYAAELSKIATEKPEAVFVFLPGGMGVNFVKQFRQAGLADKVIFLSAFTVDESTLPAQKDAALGMFGGANWAPNLATPQNQAFVAALLIDSAVRQVKGDLADKAALRAALKNADFRSLRGAFKFNNNHYPIQDFYLVKVAKRADGKFQTEIVKKILEQDADAYAKDCPLK